MDPTERRHILFTSLIFLALTVITIIWLTTPVSPLKGPGPFLLFSGGVLLGLGVIAWLEFGQPRRSRLLRQYRRIGAGYGLIEAMKSATRKIDKLRRQAEDGDISAQRAATEEERMVQALARFYNDQRWKQVFSYKRANQEEQAKAIAQQIRLDYGL